MLFHNRVKKLLGTRNSFLIDVTCYYDNFLRPLNFESE